MVMRPDCARDRCMVLCVSRSWLTFDSRNCLLSLSAFIYRCWS